MWWIEGRMKKRWDRVRDHCDDGEASLTNLIDSTLSRGAGRVLLAEQFVNGLSQLFSEQDTHRKSRGVLKWV